MLFDFAHQLFVLNKDFQMKVCHLNSLASDFQGDADGLIIRFNSNLH